MIEQPNAIQELETELERIIRMMIEVDPNALLRINRVCHAVLTAGLSASQVMNGESSVDDGEGEFVYVAPARHYLQLH